jgi:hypothetical protein
VTRLLALQAAQTSAPAAKSGTVEERGEAFKPVDGASNMQSGEALLVEAYAAFWLVLFALVAFGWRRQRQLDQRVGDLEAALDRARAAAESGEKKSA